jgi:hypothetical protein
VVDKQEGELEILPLIAKIRDQIGSEIGDEDDLEPEPVAPKSKPKRRQPKAAESSPLQADSDVSACNHSLAAKQGEVESSPQWNRYVRSRWAVDHPDFPCSILEKLYVGIATGFVDQVNPRLALEFYRCGLVVMQYHQKGPTRPPQQSSHREFLIDLTVPDIEAEIRSAIGSEEMTTLQKMRDGPNGQASTPKIFFLWCLGERSKFEYIPGSHRGMPMPAKSISLDRPNVFAIVHPQLMIRDLFETVKENASVATVA